MKRYTILLAAAAVLSGCGLMQSEKV
ncbi:MAG: lipoprotein, partial [Phycisphaerae bacterium]|nr:lipoprotein [Phycisphaerae bacterium]